MSIESVPHPLIFNTFGSHNMHNTNVSVSLRSLSGKIHFKKACHGLGRFAFEWTIHILTLGPITPIAPETWLFWILGHL